MIKKERLTADLGQNDLFKFYKETRKHDIKMTQATYTKIISMFNREIIKMILYKNYNFMIPYYLGNLYIVKTKQPNLKYDEDGNLIKKGLLIDYKKTKELWERNPKAKAEKKIVLQMNDHTDGHVYKFKWEKSWGRIKNLKAYKFRPSRENARWLASVIKDPNLNVDYFLK